MVTTADRCNDHHHLTPRLFLFAFLLPQPYEASSLATTSNQSTSNQVIVASSNPTPNNGSITRASDLVSAKTHVQTAAGDSTRKLRPLMMGLASKSKGGDEVDAKLQTGGVAGRPFDATDGGVEVKAEVKAEINVHLATANAGTTLTTTGPTVLTGVPNGQGGNFQIEQATGNGNLVANVYATQFQLAIPPTDLEGRNKLFDIMARAMPSAHNQHDDRTLVGFVGATPNKTTPAETTPTETTTTTEEEQAGQEQESKHDLVAPQDGKKWETWQVVAMISLVFFSVAFPGAIRLFSGKILPILEKILLILEKILLAIRNFVKLPFRSFAS